MSSLRAGQGSGVVNLSRDRLSTYARFSALTEMQTHLQERPLVGQPDVTAYFATDPGRKAVVFVHGYGGSAIKTWSDFHLLASAEAPCRRHDLFFYGYDGLRSELVASAGFFRDFLGTLLMNGTDLVNGSLPAQARRPPDFAYDEVVVVAHSLGAVIARWALLSAREAGMTWMPKTKLVFFAPAHMGARVVDLAVQAVGGFSFLGLFAKSAQFQSPLIDQLSDDSKELTRLREKVIAALGEGDCDYLIPRAVIIAEYERIVRNLKFGSDPEPIPLRGTDHFTVCKPRSDRREPLDRLLAVL